jgi:DNA sulfur modification protein DndB
MATVIPAIKAQMGSIPYYETTMTAQELAASVRPAQETDGWASATIEDRIQRELNEKRVKDEIVPYLRKAADRFFGAVIVLLMDGKLEFEDVTEFGLKVPSAQRSAAARMGFLNIVGGERIVLDGQHRLAALRSVVQRNFEEDGEADFSAEVPSDEVCVIFIEFENAEKTRRIFNKVNRSARVTTRADNIITSEDDGFAIVTRRLVRNDAPLGITHPPKNELIVDWKHNTIGDRSLKLTTISAVYETVKDIVDAEGIGMVDEKKSVVRPSEDELHEAYEAAGQWWGKLMATITPFKQAAANPAGLPKMRKEGTYKLLLKPNGQQALVKGLARAVERGADLDQAIERANRIDWASMKLWENVLIKPNGGMIARSEAYKLAANLISYLVASENTSEEQRAALNHDFAIAKAIVPKDAAITDIPDSLPPPIVA